MIKQLPAIDERHDEVQFIGSLEREFQWHDERIVDQRKHSPLSKDMCDFTGTGCNVGFSDRFESVYSLCIFFSYLHNLSKTALPDNFEQVERINGQWDISRWLEINLEVERP